MYTLLFSILTFRWKRFEIKSGRRCRKRRRLGTEDPAPVVATSLTTRSNLTCLQDKKSKRARIITEDNTTKKVDMYSVLLWADKSANRRKIWRLDEHTQANDAGREMEVNVGRRS